MDDAHDPPLTFPDLPRLELDQLLGQLVDRAHEVIATQSRLRGLLRANQMITGDLALPALLRHIVEAARELGGARYAALGVNAHTGGLAQFVHSGMSPETVRAIGDLPQGRGLLGALVEDPVPIRVERIADDPRSSGFPEHHPPMDGFLGVPIRVRGEVFGNLYLCESNSGGFSSEDEDLVTALAATAGVAIANARLYDAARVRHEWLGASATITRRLLSTEPGDPLQLVVDLAHDVAGADLVAIVLPAEDGPDLRVEVAVGTGADTVIGLDVQVEGSLCGRVLRTGRPVRESWPLHVPGLGSAVSAQLRLDPVLVVPLVGSRQVKGVLVAARLRNRPAFTDDDLDMVTAFANQASLALELKDARAEQQRLAVADDRDRIAADLHDHVIQRLFAAGLSLQSVAKGLGAGTAADRIGESITNLDQTISQIRTTIFQLHRTTGTVASGLRGRVLDVLADVAPALGFHPETRFSGPLQSSVPDDVADDLVAVLREALTNIARHANAHSAAVDLSVHDELTLRVVDDGTGIPATGRRSGLANLAARARRHGGTLHVTRGEQRGTELSWSVPIG
ncbi:sensor histidine kinase [Pseudonocardia abyssalis]|uniref:GAF domain-containing protein n=1 Tax=Pseudonocardia abyssalis TaxID=2792008 RepID=A0ABS6UPR9_9PSEU|nr:GAF domain-containing protein [Pseudonocardia abyssalis]MBW0117791.1 GAF domain-containing protein [Pseudonocardia abyssalis]MBW0133903.1 GAF domain-containing protein [Pseudonocardia abyssalis]